MTTLCECLISGRESYYLSHLGSGNTAGENSAADGIGKLVCASRKCRFTNWFNPARKTSHASWPREIHSDMQMAARVLLHLLAARRIAESTPIGDGNVLPESEFSNFASPCFFYAAISR